MTLLNMINNIQWSKPETVQTKNGLKQLQKAPVPSWFWEMWKKHKEKIKEYNISPSRFKGKWELCLWSEYEFKEKANYTSVKIDESKLKGFKPYQIEAVKFLESVNGIGSIFDQQRIGKTIESIGYFLLHPKKRPVICVVPASVKLQWRDEIYKWTKNQESIIVLSGKTPLENIKKADWYIINYDILGEEVLNLDYYKKLICKNCNKNDNCKLQNIKNITHCDKYIELKQKKKNKTTIIGWYKTLEKIGQSIIGDEIQKISGETAIRAKAFRKMTKKILKKENSAFIPLSGTPIRGKIKEFFNVLNLLDPKTFNSRWKFKWAWCGPEHNGFGWEFNKSSNLEELHKLTKPLIIRRLRTEIIKDMPKKQKTIVPLELKGTSKKEYIKADLEFKEWLGKLNKNESKKQYSNLRQLAYVAKRNNVIRWIKDFIANDEKLVVGVYHKKVMSDLIKEFSKIAVKLDGGCSSTQRQEAIKNFQENEEIKLFFGQVEAAGLGLNLSAASAVAFVELPLVPADVEQFEDRIINTIELQDSLSIYYLVGEGTIDEDNMEMLDIKDETVSSVVDGGREETLFGEQQESFLDGLLNKYKGE